MAIAVELVEAFAGAAITLNDLNTRMLLGQPIDLNKHAQAVNAMVKVASRLGISRRARDVCTLDPLAYATARDREDACVNIIDAMDDH